MHILISKQQYNFILVLKVSKVVPIKIILRNMHNSRRVVIRAAQTTLQQNPSGLSRRNFLIEAGRMKTPIEQQQPSVGVNPMEQVQSDTTGNHSVTALTVCGQNSCHKRDCHNNDTHKKMCPLQQKNNETSSTTELVGNFTQKIPSDKQGVKLDDSNFNGEQKPQFMVTKKTAIPLDRDKNFKPNEKQTDFVTQPHVVSKIVNNLPPTSIYHQKETTNHDIPKDDE